MSLTTFAQQAFSDFQKTAAIAPSSRFLAEAMVQPLPLSKAKTVVEFGPGTGVMTRELLNLTPLSANVVTFEVNPHFVRYLRAELPDPRLEVIAQPAELAGQELRRLGIKRVDAVLSSLGLGMIPSAQIKAMMAGLMPLLDERSVFTQFQYVHRMRVENKGLHYFDVGEFLSGYFDKIRRRTVWRNLPPAFVFDCQK